MVGTTRFELATSPTPRVRSTRLSHVPTIDLRVIPGEATAGYPAVLIVHEQSLSAAYPSTTHYHPASAREQHIPSATTHLRRRKNHSSARPETPAPLASTAAGDTHSTASSVPPPTRPRTSWRRSYKSSAQNPNRMAAHPVLPSRP